MQSYTGADVFISYAHADNEVPEGAATQLGWVTTLAHNLNIGPNVRKKRIYIDHHLRVGDAFGEDLIQRVCASHLLVILLSQNYVDSQWCGNELERFIASHADDPEKPTDVFVVELAPYEELRGVPVNVERLRKRLIHAKFWLHSVDGNAPILAGYPTPSESGQVGAELYWRILNELRNAIDVRLRQQESVHTVLPPESGDEKPAPEPPDSEFDPPVGTVLLADVTEDLEASRNGLKVALEKEGIAVLPDGDYVGLSVSEFDDAIVDDIARSDLFVQLLSPTPGRKAKGFTTPLPQLQFKHALGATMPIMQWCERLPPQGTIADAAHAELFRTEFLRATTLTTFTVEVVERIKSQKEQAEKEKIEKEKAEKEKNERDRQARQSEPTNSLVRSPRKHVFLDDFTAASELKDQVRALLKDNDWGIRLLPASAPLDIDVKEIMKPCRAGITLYADRTQQWTVWSRLVFFLNHVAEAGLPIEGWGVYFLENGTVAEEFGIDSDDVIGLSKNGLSEFLRRFSP